MRKSLEYLGYYTCDTQWSNENFLIYVPDMLIYISNYYFHLTPATNIYFYSKNEMNDILRMEWF